jgi:hypothetical protein
MIALKTGRRSWFDPRGSRALAAALGDRLWSRCKGRRGLFVTLTYNRAHWASPQALYRATSDDQHVALFLRKVARLLKQDLGGRWFCKLEFQKGGWVHWHLIVLDVDPIPHAAVTRLWGHGHVWLRRVTRRAIRYTCKYVTKQDGFPMWLLSERPRSVKFIRVSPGFWGECAPRGEREESHRDGGGEDEVDAPSADDSSPHVADLSGACYVPIGERIAQLEHRIIAKDDHGRFLQVDAELGALLAELLSMSCKVIGRRDGWLVVDAQMWELRQAARLVSPFPSPPPPPPPPAALHSKGKPNPDGGRWWVPLPWWVEEWFWQHAVPV